MFSAACRTASMCLDLFGGGKIISLLSNLPSWGPGGLKYKDNKTIGRTAAPEVEKNCSRLITNITNSWQENLLKKCWS